MMRPTLTKFIEQIGSDSIAIIPAAREVIRSHDGHFRFRQDSDFYYLTGFPEPDAILVVVPSHAEHPVMLFVRPRHKEMEIWNGKRFGLEGAEKEFGANKAFDIADFNKEIGALLNGKEKLVYRFGVHSDVDQTILRILADFRLRGRKGFFAPPVIIDQSVFLHESRLIKTPEEIAIMREAADIAVEAHTEAMKTIKPGMNESEIEALTDYIFRRRGAAGVSYGTIAAGGANACILHYTENNQTLRDGDLILLDAGAEFKGYASDITSTFPINGKYTEAQREIYDVVLAVEEACIKETRVGVRYMERQQKSIELLTEGMLTLGLLKGDAKELIEKKEYEKFYMHGVGHYLGLDVHDVGRYFADAKGETSRAFEPGMILTVEPGIYVAPDAENVPDKYRGVGVRIEDDVLITESGQDVLTRKMPKRAEEIEELMRQGK